MTKDAGLRFAQCRTDGCTRVCGWECRELPPDDSAAAATSAAAVAAGSSTSSPAAAPVFGRGAQTTAQALAELAAPYNDSAAAPGMSPRLGNVIDSWYFSALGSAGWSELPSLAVGACRATIGSPGCVRGREAALQTREERGEASRLKTTAGNDGSSATRRPISLRLPISPRLTMQAARPRRRT